MVEQGTENPCVGGSIPPGSTALECSSVGLEHLADTEGVVGSSPIFPTMVLYPSGQRELFAKQSLAGSNPARTSTLPRRLMAGQMTLTHLMVVRIYPG